MALIYSTSMRNLMARRAILQGFSSPSLTIYSGAQPTPATLISSWSSYNNTNSSLLYHAQSGLTLTLAASEISIYGSALPATIPVRAGTAAWGVIWSGSVAYSSMGTSTIPSTTFMICPVTASDSNGVVKLQSASMTTSTTATITSVGFSVGF